MRGVRLQLEYEKAEERLRAWVVRSTIVVFGSARVLPRGSSRAAASKAALSSGAEPRRGDQSARWYEEARRFGRIASERGGALRPRDGARDNLIATGGGPGIMEAANRGARDAGGKTIGLNIRLPFEQYPNQYITPELNFEFHYFFMRKYWFAYMAKALVVFPGGFGTLDEFFEILTLAQTHKLAKKILVIVYGKEYWNRVLNLEALADAGTISPEDVNGFTMVDTPEEAFEVLKEGLTKYHLQPQPAKQAAEEGPEIAKTLP